MEYPVSGKILCTMICRRGVSEYINEIEKQSKSTNSTVIQIENITYKNQTTFRKWTGNFHTTLPSYTNSHSK